MEGSRYYFGVSLKLLKFSVENFKSIGELQEVNFHTGSLRLGAPVDPVSIFYGANAAGKSNVLEALSFMLSAIRYSATAWLEDGIFAQHAPVPFLLDESRGDEPSYFELIFEFGSKMYSYGFTYSRRGVSDEWMYHFPSRRWSKVFRRRSGPEEGWEWNSSVVLKSQQTELEKGKGRELALSLGARAEYPFFAEIAAALSGEVTYLPLGDNQKDQRLGQLARSMRQGKVDLDEITQMMQAADIGIVGIEIDETNLSPKLAQLARRLTQSITEQEKALGRGRSPRSFRLSPEPGAYIEASDDDIRTIAYQLKFRHRGKEQDRPLKMGAQSDGTLTWLSVAPSVVDTLRNGGVLIADELDSSLHSQLLELVVQGFTDPETNRHGAQLIFTSHETNLLENMESLGLNASSFWFVEKNTRGMTEVFPLTDFSHPKDANFEIRYLSGRYGAVPRVSPSLLREIVVRDDDEGVTEHD